VEAVSTPFALQTADARFNPREPIIAYLPENPND